MAVCEHLDQITAPLPESFEGCEECLKTDGTWVHLRVCQTCGHTGCCDNSPNRHATEHFREHNDHPLVRSFEPGENWWWCYIDDLSFDVPGAPRAPSHT